MAVPIAMSEEFFNGIGDFLPFALSGATGSNWPFRDGRPVDVTAFHCAIAEL